MKNSQIPIPWIIISISYKMDLTYFFYFNSTRYLINNILGWRLKLLIFSSLEFSFSNLNIYLVLWCNIMEIMEEKNINVLI